ncbi:MAG: hypothetical protein KDA22_15705 [Phycisphaerales bacterium]|nr:hypothetical protein [Phycisphaerales bacterium]
MLTKGPLALPELAKQAGALAVIEGDDPDAALPMDLRPEELDLLWRRLAERYETEWVRDYMVTNSRSAFIHTLASLYLREHSPELLDSMPGAFGHEAELWPTWLEAHKGVLNLASVDGPPQ